jgi:ankyrin repeat protein
MLTLLLPFAEGILDISRLIEHAAYCGNIEAVELLVDLQTRMNPDVCLTVAFELAIRSGHLELAKYLRSVQPPAPSGDLWLTVASLVRTGYLDGIRLLMESIEPPAARKLAQRMIRSALEYREKELASFFIRYIDAPETSVFFAAQIGDAGLLRRLLAGDRHDLINHMTVDGSLLCVAAASGCFEVVNFLLSVPGIDPNLCNKQCDTAFILAARNKDLAIMKAIAAFSSASLANDRRQINTAFHAAFIPDTEVVPDPDSSPHGGRLPPFSTDASLARHVDELIRFFMSFPTLDPNYHVNGRQILSIAAASQNIELLRAVLDLPCADPNGFDFLGETPLIHCAKHGFTATAAVLISHPSTRINQRNHVGATALTTAASSLSCEIVALLLASPAFDAEASNIGLALVWAIRQRAVDIFALLIDVDFDINQMVAVHDSEVDDRKFSRSNALVASIIVRDVSFVLQVVRHRRFSLARDQARRALFAAVRSADPELFRLVLRLAKRINFRNSHNESLLGYAARYGGVPNVRILIEHPDFPSIAGDAPRALGAALRAGVSLLVPLLASLPEVDVRRNLPADVNGDRGSQNLASDAWSDRAIRVPVLPTGVPPVIAAAKASRADVLTALLKVDGVDPNARAESGEPLIFMCVADPSKLDALLKCPELRINACDRLGNSALAHAVAVRAAPAVALLVEHGIDVAIRNAQGMTAWEMLFAHGEPVEKEPADQFDYVQRMMSLLQRPRQKSGWF